MTGFDLGTAKSAEVIVFAVVERIVSRHKIGDFWIVEFEALDLYEDVSVHHEFIFYTAREAYKFKLGRPVTWVKNPSGFDDGLRF
ncbi:hypothetical protein [Pantoea sp. y20]